MSPLPCPQPTPETLPYWSAAALHELHLPQCDECGRHHFYPRSECPFCRSLALTWRRVSGRGTLYSYVINYRPPPSFAERGPYVIGIVQLEEGPRLLTNIVGVDPAPESLSIDMDLIVDFEPRGDYALPVFRPDPVANEGADR